MEADTSLLFQFKLKDWLQFYFKNLLIFKDNLIAFTGTGALWTTAFFSTTQTLIEGSLKFGGGWGGIILSAVDFFLHNLVLNSKY